MFDPAVMERCEDVRPEHFAEPLHGRIWGLISERARDGRSSDPTLLAGALAGDPAFAEVGGLGFLADLMDKAPPTSVVGDFARDVRESATRRTLREFGADMTARAQTAEPVEPLVAEAERKIHEIANNGPTRDAWSALTDMLARAFDRGRTRKGLAGVATGIYDLDRALGGFRPGTVNLLAARPGMGKTTAGVQLACNIARQGRGVGFFSLEEPEELLSARFACALAYERLAPRYNGVSSNPTFEAFERGELTEAQWDRLEIGRERFAALPITVDFRSRLKPSQILAAARRLKRRWERAGLQPGVIMVDHVLHVAAEQATGNRVQDVAAISGDMLHAAKALNLPLVLLCQLSRGVESRDDKRPGLSDLRWAGELEQDAFSVTFLYRPEYYAREPLDQDDVKAWDKYTTLKTNFSNALFWLVEKNRGGRSGVEVKTWCEIGCNAIEDVDAGGYER